MTTVNSLPTLDEVARVAGVSRATVSRVVNGSPRVSPDVRSDVQAAIDRLGYVPNPLAQGLKSAPAAFIGLLAGKNFGKQVVKLI